MHYLDTLATMTPQKFWGLYNAQLPRDFPPPVPSYRPAVSLEVWYGPGAYHPIRLPGPPPRLRRHRGPLVQTESLPDALKAAPVERDDPPPRRARRRRRFAPDTDMRHARPYGTTLVKRLLSAGRVMPEYDRTGRDDERWRRSYDRTRHLTL